MSLRRRGRRWWIDFTTAGGERIRCPARTADKTQAQEIHDKLKAEAWRVCRLGEKPRRSWDEAALKWLTETQHKRTHAEDRAKIRWLQQFLRGRYLDEVTHVAVIGAGKLAQEILPFLADDGRSVDQWGRRQLDAPDDGVPSTVPTALIVAAPVSSGVVERVAARYGALRSVIDLRGELGLAALHVAAPIITLQDLFARMAVASGSVSHRIEAARHDIASRSRRYELRHEVRPFGWDDLCA